MTFFRPSSSGAASAAPGGGGHSRSTLPVTGRGWPGLLLLGTALVVTWAGAAPACATAPGSAPVAAADAGPVPAGSGPARAMPVGSPPSQTLVVRAGRISAHLDRVPLATVLATLARALPVQVSVVGSWHQATVSAVVRDEPLEPALRHLLRDQSYVLVQDSSVPADPAIVRIVIVGSAETGPAASASLWRPPDPSPGGEVPVPGQPRATAPRFEPLETVDETVQAGLLMSLADTDEDVRAAALRLVQATGGMLPEGLVRRVASRDASPNLRIQALDLLVVRQGARARAALRQALWDPDPEVRETALRLLERLGPDGCAAAGGCRPTGRRR